MNQQYSVKRPIAFTVATISMTLSTTLFPVNAEEAKAKTNTCSDLNKVSMTLPKSVEISKLSTTFIARTRRNLRFRLVAYYGDSNFKRIVGIWRLNCDGSSHLSGRRTRFSKEILYETCCGSLPC